MSDANEKLGQVGNLLSILLAVVVLQMFWMLQSVETFDEHGQRNADLVAEKLDSQDAALRELKSSVEGLRQQQRMEGALRDAMREGVRDLADQLRSASQQPQVIVVGGGGNVGGGAVVTQPQQGGGVAEPNPPQGGGETPAEPVETPVEGGEGEGMDTDLAGTMGTDDAIPGPDSEAVVGGTYVMSYSEPSTLNYYTTSEGVTRQIVRYMIEPLFALSEQDPTQLTPKLATSWEVGEDQLTYTFHLRRGVTWSDGAPFTADDVLFTFNVIRDETVNAEAYRSAFQDVESFEKVDDYTVRVKYSKPYWKGLYVVGYSLWVLPKHWYEQRIGQVARAEEIEPFPTAPGDEGFGACFNKISEPPVGTGPYVMGEGAWVRNESLTLQRNPNWWGHEVLAGQWNLEKLRIRFISDHQAQLTQVRQQNLDVMVVKRDEWLDSLQHEAVVRDNYEYYRYDHVGIGYNFIAWNCRQYPFNDARVRRAMTHLLDRRGLLEDLWRNNGTIATCMGKPVYEEYNHDLVPLEYDINEAVRLLAQAGFRDIDGDGVLDKQVDGEWKPFSFTLKVPSGITEYERIANRFKESLEEAGVHMEVQPLEWSTFISQFYELDFDAMCLYNSFQDPWIDNYESVHSSEVGPRGGNAPGLINEEIDTLVETIRETFDREERIRMTHRLHEIIQQEQPRTLIVHGKVNVLLHRRFQNVIVRHAGMRSTYWWVRPEDRMHDD